VGGRAGTPGRRRVHSSVAQKQLTKQPAIHKARKLEAAKEPHRGGLQGAWEVAMGGGGGKAVGRAVYEASNRVQFR